MTSRWPGTALLVVMLLGATVASADGKTITRGQVAQPDLGSCSGCDVFQLATAPPSPSYRVPKGKWKIIKWSAQGGGTDDGSARLRVWRKTDVPGQYKLVRQSQVETIGADEHPKLATSLKVRRGDRLGIHTVLGLPAAKTAGTASGDEEIIISCDPTGVGFLAGSGTACPANPHPFALANVWAKLEKL